MKPEKRVCEQCGKEITRGKFCSPKCKMANRRSVTNRNTVGDENVTQSVTNETVTSQKDESVTRDDFRADLTKTDKTFYDRAMRDFKEPYYRFEDKLREASCFQCGKRYKTSLSLLRFCSYEHYKKPWERL